MSTTLPEGPPLVTPPAFAGAPICDRHQDCRFVRNGPVKITDEGWTPIYDRQGIIVNAIERDRGSMPMLCQTCGREFDHPM